MLNQTPSYAESELAFPHTTRRLIYYDIPILSIPLAVLFIPPGAAQGASKQSRRSGLTLPHSPPPHGRGSGSASRLHGCVCVRYECVCMDRMSVSVCVCPRPPLHQSRSFCPDLLFLPHLGLFWPVREFAPLVCEPPMYAGLEKPFSCPNRSPSLRVETLRCCTLRRPHLAPQASFRLHVLSPLGVPANKEKQATEPISV